MTAIFTPTEEIPEDTAVFDTSNGCYYHACGFFTSWFRRNGDGWSILEWATYLHPDYSGALCNALESFNGEGMFTVEFSSL